MRVDRERMIDVMNKCSMESINVELLEKVKKLAYECGEMIRDKQELRVQNKAEHDFVTSKDIEVSDYLLSRLPGLLPASIVVSEEAPSSVVDPSVPRWIVDPIDGTTNFMFDSGLYAVSIGLLVQDEPVLGVVYNPAADEMFSGLSGHGAFLNDREFRVNGNETLGGTVILVETNPYGDRNSNITFHMMRKVFQKSIDIRVLGSAALDICYVACGRGGAAVMESIKPWDYAGAGAILKAAGGEITDWSGQKNRYLGSEGVVASNGRLHAEILAEIGA